MSSKHERNWAICQLRGSLPRIVSIIPDDIPFSDEDRVTLKQLATKLLAALDASKVKRFTCSKCSNTTLLHQTTNKKAYHCDICNKYVEKLYCIRKTNV